MGVYAKYVLPKMIHLVCGLKPNMRQREKVVPLASGRVLEIGAGSGLNLAFYDASKVKHLFALDPSVEAWAIAEEKARGMKFPVDFIEAPAESIPLESESVDSIIVTYSLCTIPAARRAVLEMRRVLRKGGELIFCEHGLAPDPVVRQWQNRINPVWMPLAGVGFTDEHRLHYLTRRLWSWRSEFGAETYWSERLGRAVMARGADQLWPAITSRP